MKDGDLLFLRGEEVFGLLEGNENEVIEQVAAAYELHRKGRSSLPHSSFLRFPDDPANRIICLPAYLGGDYAVAGMKWIASFPGNVARGIDRASALLALNSATTGRPSAVMEASIISAKRTAASAALAARVLTEGRARTPVGLIGCGLIAFEILRFLDAALDGVEEVLIFDLSAARAAQFTAQCEKVFPDLVVETASDVHALLERSPLVAFATTAGEPHLHDLSMMAPGSAVLHVSLRDLGPEVILAADNVVDDLDHVARAATSIHLTETAVGNRDFVRCTLADILLGDAPARRDAGSLAVFSPFGLGVLDLAVAHYVQEKALAAGKGWVVEGFLPDPWTERG